MTILAIVAMGLFVALVSVFLGLGGGILLVPLLPTLFGLSINEAVATSLMTIFLVVSLNTWRFHYQQHGLVHWAVVLMMGPFSAVAAFFAAQVSTMVDTKWILIVLAAILVLVALRSFFSSLLNKKYVVSDTITVKQRYLAGAGGVVAGLTSGFAGIGSGAILAPLMIFMRLVTPQQLAPTSNANMVFTTFAGAASFILSGAYVNWNQWGLIRLDIAIGIFITAAVAAQFLRPYQHRLPFIAKSILLNLLLLFLVGKIVNMLFFE